jgi:hypothetical protein
MAIPATVLNLFCPQDSPSLHTDLFVGAHCVPGPAGSFIDTVQFHHHFLEKSTAIPMLPGVRKPLSEGQVTA